MKSNKKKVSYDELIKYQIIAASILGVIVILLSIVYYILVNYQVETVYVEGNAHYTAEQVRRIVQSDALGDNTLYLSFKYSNKSVTNIPFVEKMDIDILDKNTIKITVYEKTLAGYVEYLGRYMYFDKDGIVIESSAVKTAGIPLVTGLNFDHFIMYEPLPVDNNDIFQTILNVTQILNKYEIDTDKIRFNDKYEMTLFFGDVKVNFGDTALLEEKMQMLNAILSQLEGQSGILEMSNYSSDNQNITFTRD